MDFVTEKADLSRTLEMVLHIVPPKTTLPVLSNLLLDVKSEAITVVSTDLDTSISTTVPGKVKTEGVMTLPARRLGEIVRLSRRPSGSPRRETAFEPMRKMTLAWRGTLRRIKIPVIQSKEAPLWLVRPADGRQIVAVSKDETRPALNGIFWRIEPTRMEMVATDGYRLSKIEKTGKFSVKGKKEFLVSPKALGQMVYLFGDSGEGEVEITVDNNYLVFSFGGTVVYSRLLEGPFPARAVIQRTTRRSRLSTSGDHGVGRGDH
jgi:DNA polymerase-3 subunit beta